VEDVRDDVSDYGEHGDPSVFELGFAVLCEVIFVGEVEWVEELVPEGWGGAELVGDWEGCSSCFGGWIEEGCEGSFFSCCSYVMLVLDDCHRENYDEC